MIESWTEGLVRLAYMVDYDPIVNDTRRTKPKIYVEILLALEML